MAGSTHQEQVRGSHMQIGRERTKRTEIFRLPWPGDKLLSRRFIQKVRAFHTESLDQPAADGTAAVRRQFGYSLVPVAQLSWTLSFDWQLLGLYVHGHAPSSTTASTTLVVS